MNFLDSLVGLYMFAGAPFSFYEIAQALTIPGWGVIITLVLQTVYLIAIGIERYLTYNKAKQQSRLYAPKVAQALKSSNLEEAIAIGDKFKDSHLAMVVSSGLKEFQAHQGSSAISSDELESSKRSLERAIAVKTAELTADSPDSQPSVPPLPSSDSSVRSSASSAPSRRSVPTRRRVSVRSAVLSPRPSWQPPSESLWPSLRCGSSTTSPTR